MADQDCTCCKEPPSQRPHPATYRCCGGGNWGQCSDPSPGVPTAPGVAWDKVSATQTISGTPAPVGMPINGLLGTYGFGVSVDFNFFPGDTTQEHLTQCLGGNYHAGRYTGEPTAAPDSVKKVLEYFTGSSDGSFTESVSFDVPLAPEIGSCIFRYASDPYVRYSNNINTYSAWVECEWRVMGFGGIDGRFLQNQVPCPGLLLTASSNSTWFTNLRIENASLIDGSWPSSIYGCPTTAMLSIRYIGTTSLVITR